MPPTPVGQVGVSDGARVRVLLPARGLAFPGPGSLRLEFDMRTLKVRHQPLPHVGELFELVTASGFVVTVVSHRSGKRDLVVRRPDEDEPLANAGLTKNESAAIAALLVGAHIELRTSEQP